MTVKIYGAIQAECTQRIVLICYELRIPFHLIAVDLVNKDQKTPEWIANMQPFGQIPVLEDEDGLRIFESRAICRFLAENYGGSKLLPVGRKARAVFEQAASVEQNYFNDPAKVVVGHRYIRKVMNLPTNEERAKEAQENLKEALYGYEVLLSKQKYLAGDEITLADLFHLPIGSYLEKVGVDALVSDDTPNIARWWKDISSRASWKRVLTDIEKAGPLLYK